MDSIADKVTFVNRQNNQSYPLLLYSYYVTFDTWLNSELKERNWSRNELARRAGISDVSLTLIYGGKRKPGVNVCTAIAEVLKVPPELVFRRAGLLPPIPDTEEIIEMTLHEMGLMSSEDRQEVLEYARMRRRLAEENPKK